MRAYQRGRRWWIDFSIRGKRFREPTDAVSKAEALIRGAKRLAEAAESPARKSSRQRLVDVTFQEALDAWLRDEESRIGKAAAWRWSVGVRSLRDRFGPDRPIRLLAGDDVEGWIEYRSTQVKHSSVRWDLTKVRRFIKFCRQHFRSFDEDPTNNLCNEPKMVVTRRPPPEPDEVLSILERTKNDRVLGPVYMIAIYSGLTRTEIARLTWEDVDLDRGIIYVPRGKTQSRNATLPIHPKLRAWFAERAASSGPVVAKADGTHYSPDTFTVYMINARLPSFHLCRHALATRLVRSGVPMQVVSKLLRHRSTSVTETHYAHLRPVDCADELASLDYGEDD